MPTNHGLLPIFQLSRGDHANFHHEHPHVNPAVFSDPEIIGIASYTVRNKRLEPEYVPIVAELT